MTRERQHADDYDAAADFAGSLMVAYQAIRERMARGGPAWQPKLQDQQVCAVNPAGKAGRA